MLLSLLNSHFNTYQLAIIIFSCLAGITSLLFLLRKNNFKIALFFLAIAAIILRFGMIGFDPFLNLWDEQFHALVAKNLMNNFFKPILVTEPILDYNLENWTANHIWLHKPPLFLWQIALSFKIFGVNEIALRIPSAIMSLITIYMVYKIGTYFLNKYIAYFAILILIFSSFINSLVAGYHHTDHNDIAFIFYVTASLWAWTKFLFSKNKKIFIFLVGIFSGAAILTKWLPGLLIFAVWFIFIITNKSERSNFKSYLYLFFAFLVALAVCLPWNIYAYLNFTEEFYATFIKKASHFSYVVEKHDGNIFYHWLIMHEIYFKYAYILIIPALYFLYKKIKCNKSKLALISFFAIPFLFYSFAATKMPAFTLISSSIIYLAFGTLIYETIFFIKGRKYRFWNKTALTLLLVATIFISFDIKEIKKIHTNSNTENANYREIRKNSKRVFVNLKTKYPAKSVIINCRKYDSAFAMFYTSFIAYDHYPSEQNFEKLKNTNKTILVLVNEYLPQHIYENKNIIFIDDNYW